MSKSYSEKLKDPRWQKKRLEILERDDWCCQCCFDTENTLSVHHVKYIKGREPWDYDESYFITLCSSCHGYETENLKSAVSLLVDSILCKFKLSDNIAAISNSIDELKIIKSPEVTADILNYIITNEGAMERHEEDYFNSLHKKAGRHVEP